MRTGRFSLVHREPIFGSRPTIKSSVPITIGYDASSTVGQRTGIGIAAAHLLSAMAEELPDGWKIRALVNSGKHPLPTGDAWTRAKNVEIIHTRIPGRILLRSWQHLGIPAIEFLTRETALHHSPASYIFPARRARRIVTVHDLFFLQAENFGGGKEAEDAFGGDYFRQTFPQGLKQLDKIITVSEYTRADVIAKYGIAPEKIVTIPNGADLETFNPTPRRDDRELTEVWSRGEPYLLCVASSGPNRRKNVVGLLEAYAVALARPENLPRLLIAGHRAASESETLFWAKVDELKLRERVVTTGYMTANHLAAFYRSAVASVVPSLCEGFGIPVIESMACGCPVLVADSGALPEVAGEAGLRMDITSTEEMARRIIELATDAALRARLKELGLIRAPQFNWRSSARKTIEVYREILGLGDHD